MRAPDRRATATTSSRRSSARPVPSKAITDAMASFHSFCSATSSSLVISILAILHLGGFLIWRSNAPDLPVLPGHVPRNQILLGCDQTAKHNRLDYTMIEGTGENFSPFAGHPADVLCQERQ